MNMNTDLSDLTTYDIQPLPNGRWLWLCRCGACEAKAERTGFYHQCYGPFNTEEEAERDSRRCMDAIGAMRADH
jgi:hypothetical protein